MLALGMVYLQYWVCEDVVVKRFFSCITLMKVAFHVAKKTKNGVVAASLLNSKLLNLQFFF
jgi:hypothetical protein